jgi:hypothetical protein
MLKFELKCEICNSKFDLNYNIPKVLVCGHTVCSKCVDRMKEKNLTRCPFDRKLIDFEEDKIAINYYILSLIDGSIKDNINTCEDEVEEEFSLSPKPVINSPGWKNTLDGFIRGDILFTIESNGFFYCTDLNTGEWWFLYLNQFYGKHFFQVPNKTKMYMIDQYGNLFQTFTKNYYTQIGKKGAWRNTNHLCMLNDKLYSVESSNKLYETNLDNGKWREIGARKEIPEEEESNREEGGIIQIPQILLDNSSRIFVENLELSPNSSNTLRSNDVQLSQNQIRANSATPSNSISLLDTIFEKIGMQVPNFLRSNSDNTNDAKKIKAIEPYFDLKDVTLLISTHKSLIAANKQGELYLINEKSGETYLLRNDFSKNIETYSSNSSHIYYVEKGSGIIYRNHFGSGDAEELKDLKEIKLNQNSDSNFNDCQTNVILIEKDEVIIKRANSLNYQRKSSENCIKNTKFLESEKFMVLEPEITVSKIFVDDSRLVITDKNGELNVINISNKTPKKFQCMFMLRNCHVSNTIIVGDGDLLIIDPIRLSLNKLNILTGSEVILVHSFKFLSSIKFIFSCNSRIYFIDISGSLFYFLENEKKITQIGNTGLCKYILDFAVHKNYLYTIENTTLYRTNLSDGSYLEIKNDYSTNYKFFFADNVHLVFINKDDEVFLLKPEDNLKLVKKFYIKDVSQRTSVSYFKNHIIYYNIENKSIEGLSLQNDANNLNTELLEFQSKTEIRENGVKIFINNFPEVNLFINNYDCLACILKDGVIYKLFC